MMAAMGTIPWARYKSAGDIYKRFAPNPQGTMRFDLHLTAGDDDIELTREIYPKGGSITQEVYFMGNHGGVQKIQPMIDEFLGLDAKLLDFSQFIDASPAEQKRYLFSLVGEPPGITKESVKREIAEYLLKIPEPDDEWEEDALSNAVNELMRGWPVNLPVNGALEALEKHAGEMLNQARAKLKQLNAGRAVTPFVDYAGDIRKLQDELATLETREKELIKTIAEEKARVTAHNDWVKDYKTFETNLETALDRLSKVEANYRTADYDKTIAKLKKSVHAKGDYEQLRQELGELEAKLPDLEAAQDETKSAFIEARNQADAYQRIVGFIGSDERLCPAAAGLKMKCAMQWDTDEIQKLANKSDKEVEERKVAADKAKKDRDECRTKIDEITTQIKTWESADIITKDKIKTTTNNKTTAEENVQIQKDNVKVAQDQYDNHIANDKRIVAGDEKATLQAEINKIQAEIPGLKEKVKGAEKHKQAKLAEKKLNIDIIRAEEMVTITKALVDKTGPSGILGDALIATIAPAIKRVNSYLPYECFIRPNDGGLDIGMNVPGRGEVSLVSLSDGERALFAAVIAIVFMALKNAEIRFLVIDKLNDIDGGRRKVLFEIIRKAIENGDLTNFIGSFVYDPDDEDSLPLKPYPGIEVVDLSMAGVTANA